MPLQLVDPLSRPVGRTAPPDDDLLLAELNAPPPLAEAREALAYWKQRLHSLPARRRRARREAAEMVERWQVRVRAAERAHYGPRLTDPLYDLAATLRPMVSRWIATGLKLTLLAALVTALAIVAAGIIVWPAVHKALEVLTGIG
jgi:hypothetical protein